jgi:hypothetical protein
MADHEVHHDTEKGKFYTTLDGKEAKMTYKKVDDATLVYDHTFVPGELRGKGVAGAVVKTALEWAREQGYKVVPGCSYVRSYLKRHPEFGDVVDESG